MTAIGPRGVLPPGEWAVGARVYTTVNLEAVSDQRGTSVERGLVESMSDDGFPTVFVPCYHCLSSPGRKTDTQLDLRTGCLSHGTRALLRLVAPEVEQPLCAPLWERFGRQWTLTVHHGDGWTVEWRFTEHGVYHGSTRVMDTPDGLLDIEDPRLALVAALEKASER